MIEIRDSWFESCAHEGIVVSDNGWGVPKRVRVDSTVITRCQQGAELGFSTHFTV